MIKRHDRNGKKQSASQAGHHRPSDAHGKVRAKAGSDHGEKRTQASAKGTPKEKSSVVAKQKPAASPEERLIPKAREWARLHANPRTRAKMDDVLVGLNNADKRLVVLCGQRIANGLSAKLATK